MNLTDAELRWLLWCCGEEQRNRADPTRRRVARPVSPHLARLIRRLELEVAVSESGHESECDGGTLETEQLITAQEAACILGLSKRQAQRLGPRLGRLIGGRWVFNLSAVNEHLEGRDDGIAG